jgi:hypothetical protein
MNESGSWNPALYGEISGFIKSALSGERCERHMIDLDTIKFAHLDKLLAELRAWIKRGPSYKQDCLWLNVTWLQRAWIVRFQSDYFDLDKMRTADLLESGGQGMKGVVFAIPSKADKRVMAELKCTDDEAMGIETMRAFREGQ